MLAAATRRQPSSPSFTNPLRLVRRLMSRSTPRFAMVFLGALLLLAIGCGKPPRSRPSQTVTAAHSTNQELTQALDLLRQLDQIDQTQASADLVYLLNRWSQTLPPDNSWKPDELAGRLPKQLRELYSLDSLERNTFDMHDTRLLLEAYWSRDISEWVRKQASPEPFTDWLKTRQPTLPKEQAEQLRVAERLFDWTIRNVQLDPLLPYASEAVGATLNADGKAETSAPQAPPYARGVAGPGYQRQAWQTLLMGHGDAWERARVFGLLARQQSIETVVLAIFDVTVSPRPQAWTVAVLLGEELFLFDPALGLPLPTGDGQGIATLTDLRAHPEWLESLDIDTETRYSVRNKDLQNVVALIDATPASLALRMHRLEKQMAGEHRMILASFPSQVADRVRKCQGVNSVNLWTAPWEAEIYTAALGQLANSNPPPEVLARLAEESMFGNLGPLVQGRHRHFHGAFANEEEEKGAKGYYLQSRFPDELIEKLGSDERAQRAIGLVRDRFESDNAWANKLRFAQMYSKSSKTHASYWLGLVHYESGQYDVAVDWLKGRTLEAAGDSPWKNGARYNLARTYEQLGKKAEASALYREDNSPQRHGNLLRARKL
jgi:hypothetical protein